MNMASADAATALAVAASGKGTVAPYFIFRTAIMDQLCGGQGCYTGASAAVFGVILVWAIWL